MMTPASSLDMGRLAAGWHHASLPLRAPLAAAAPLQCKQLPRSLQACRSGRLHAVAAPLVELDQRGADFCGDGVSVLQYLLCCIRHFVGQFEHEQAVTTAFVLA